MRILTVPGDTAVLRTKSRPVEKIDMELLAFLKELGETLKGQKDPAGVGLSAIQVGKAIRAFAMFLPQPGPRAKGQGPREKPILQFYVNPEIAEHAAQMTLGEELGQGPIENRPFLEGCLSIPRIYGAVLRWPWIKVKYQILSGVEVSDTLQGLQARVFQHELDHLNGILFTDHVLAQGNLLYQDSGNGMEEVNL